MGLCRLGGRAVRRVAPTTRGPEPALIPTPPGPKPTFVKPPSPTAVERSPHRWIAGALVAGALADTVLADPIRRLPPPAGIATAAKPDPERTSRRLPAPEPVIEFMASPTRETASLIHSPPAPATPIVNPPARTPAPPRVAVDRRPTLPHRRPTVGDARRRVAAADRLLRKGAHASARRVAVEVLRDIAEAIGVGGTVRQAETALREASDLIAADRTDAIDGRRGHATFAALQAEGSDDSAVAVTELAGRYRQYARVRLAVVATSDPVAADAIEIWAASLERGRRGDGASLCLRRACVQGRPDDVAAARRLHRQLCDVGLSEEADLIASRQPVVETFAAVEVPRPTTVHPVSPAAFAATSPTVGNTMTTAYRSAPVESAREATRKTTLQTDDSTEPRRPWFTRLWPGGDR